MSSLYPPPGGNAAGPRFVGFESEIEMARRHLLEADEPVNLAVVGLPGSGKSSFTSEVLSRFAGELDQLDRIVIQVNSSQFTSPRQCFGLIALQAATALRARSRGAFDIVTLARNLTDHVGDEGWTAFYIDICDFFARLRESGIQVVVVLEEFDQIRSVFRGSIEGFGLLLELSSSPKYRIGLITVSRRTPFEIETMTGAISNLAPVLPLLILQLRGLDFAVAVARRVFESSQEVASRWASEVQEVTAGHPYLVTLFAREASLAAAYGGATDPRSLIDAVWPQASELRVRMNKFCSSVRGHDLESGRGTESSPLGTLSRYDQLIEFSRSLRRLEASRFDGSSLQDEERSAGGRVTPSNLGVLVMGSQFNIGSAQAGAIGDHATSTGNSLQQNIANVGASVDVTALAKELSALLHLVRTEDDVSISALELMELEAAESAAKEGDEAGALDHLARAGKWILSKAEAVGLVVLAEAAKRIVFP